MELLDVDVREAARLLSISPYTVRTHIRKGRIRASKVGSRVIVSMEEVRRLAREGATASQSPEGVGKINLEVKEE